MDKDLPNTNPESPQIPEVETEKPTLVAKVENEMSLGNKENSEKKSIKILPIKAAPFIVNKLTKEEQQKLLIERNRMPFGVLILKLVAFLLLLLSFFSFTWFFLDLSDTNILLSAFGRPENTRMKFKRLEKQNKFYDTENQKIESKIRQFESRLKNKTYFVYTQIINEIQEGQYQWFNEIDEEGKIQKYGVLDGVENIKDYFNSRNYKHPILMAGNNIELGNVTASREKINFNVKGSNLFGKTFFLNVEFIQMLNSFPFYKDGEIRNFLRKRMKDGSDGMNFSLKLNIQKPEEEDPADIRFAEYKNWAQTFIKTKKTPKINK